jgi:prephenate dehydratase
VESGSSSFGIVPIENSLAGSIHQNYDLLLAHPLHIIGETHLRVEHVLMGGRGSSMRTLRAVRSHPQALAQCSRFFRAHPSLEAVPYFDTAGAAQSVRQEGRRDIGAIAGAYAARLYGLKVLRRNLEDSRGNFTRFLVLGRRAWAPRPGVATKTSVVFAPAQNRTGVLFRILGVFALRDIDLTKIESRPDPSTPFNYLFYVDFAGDRSQKNVAGALDHLASLARELRVLGSYPRGRGHL